MPVWYEPLRRVAIPQVVGATPRSGGGVEDGVVVQGDGMGAAAQDGDLAAGAALGEVTVLGRSLLARCLPVVLRDLGFAAEHRALADVGEGVAVLVIAGPLDDEGELPAGVPVVVAARSSGAGWVERPPAPIGVVDDLAALIAAIADARTGAPRSRPARATSTRVADTRVASPLTEREREVFALVEQGRSAATIAEALGISIHTARTHVQNILRKLGVGSRLEAIAVHDLRSRG